MSMVFIIMYVAFTCQCQAENVHRSDKRTTDSSCNAILNTTSKQVDGISWKIDTQEDTLVEEIRTLDRHIFTRIDAIEDRILELEEVLGDGGSTKELSKKLDRILDKMDEKEENLVDSIQSSDKRLVRKVTTIRTTVEQLLLKGRPCTCLDIKNKGITKSGVYNVFVNSKYIPVYCNMDIDDGGWLVFQRRKDGSVDFYRDWETYKTGFGDLTEEFWLGNENLYQVLSNSGQEFELRIDLEDFEGEKRFAKYSTFKIASEDDNYRLTVGGYSGDAGDAMTYQNYQQFTTKDKDNDKMDGGNCAQTYKGAWWYEGCHESNLNGQYLHGQHASLGDGVEWTIWKKHPYSLKFTEMKIRPKI